MSNWRDTTLKLRLTEIQEKKASGKKWDAF